MKNFDAAYWENRYRENLTGWDIGYVSTPLKEYFDQIENKNCKILIPGAGNAYEAEYLFQNGFRNIYVLDWSASAIHNLKGRVSDQRYWTRGDIPEDHLLQGDFFQHKGKYDLIIEQTFFCALDPALRPDYAAKMHDLLAENGKLAGVLFNIPLNMDNPPFGGSAGEYKKYFAPFFNFIIFEECYNSIPPRQGNELFIILQKK